MTRCLAKVGRTVYLSDRREPAAHGLPGRIVKVEVTNYGMCRAFTVRWKGGAKSVHSANELRATPPDTPREIYSRAGGRPLRRADGPGRRR